MVVILGDVKDFSFALVTCDNDKMKFITINNKQTDINIQKREDSTRCYAMFC